jgi:hypothetical protein
MARLVITCRRYGKIAIGATLSLEEVPAKVRNPPGEAIRGPSRSSTALDPEPTAQTDPFRTFGRHMKRSLLQFQGFSGMEFMRL